MTPSDLLPGEARLAQNARGVHLLLRRHHLHRCDNNIALVVQAMPAASGLVQYVGNFVVKRDRTPCLSFSWRGKVAFVTPATRNVFAMTSPSTVLMVILCPRWCTGLALRSEGAQRHNLRSP